MSGNNPGCDVLSLRQMMVLLAVVLLAPATDLLPSLAARQVGKGGWFIGIGILPVLLLALWLVGRLFCGRGICEQVGRPMGNSVIILWLFWIAFVLAASLRFSAVRMEKVYGSVPSFCLSVLLTAVSVWVGRGKVAALARAAEIFYLALTVLLAAVLVLALFQMEPQNLYPLEWERVPGGSLRAAGILLNVVPMAVLGARVPVKFRSWRRAARWIVSFCAVIALVLAAVLGCAGSGLTARLESPYLIMVQGLGIKGAFQRTEALVASMWLLSDLILCAALLQAGRYCAEQIMPKKWGVKSVPVLAAVALTVGWLLFPEENIANFCVHVLPVSGIVLGLVFPALLQIIAWLRTGKRR